MATKTYSDVSGKEIPVKDQVHITVNFTPYLDDRDHVPYDLEFDISLKEQKAVEKGIAALFPKAE